MLIIPKSEYQSPDDVLKLTYLYQFNSLLLLQCIIREFFRRLLHIKVTTRGQWPRRSKREINYKILYNVDRSLEILANGKCSQFLVCSIPVQSAIYEHIVFILDRLVDVCQFQKNFRTQEGLNYMGRRTVFTIL
jgi:hypothetical protein